MKHYTFQDNPDYLVQVPEIGKQYPLIDSTGKVSCYDPKFAKKILNSCAVQYNKLLQMGVSHPEFISSPEVQSKREELHGARFFFNGIRNLTDDELLIYKQGEATGTFPAFVKTAGVNQSSAFNSLKAQIEERESAAAQAKAENEALRKQIAEMQEMLKAKESKKSQPTLIDGGVK